MFTAKEIIQHACVDAHLTMSNVAERMGMSRSLFNNRLNTGKFTMEEWSKLNNVIGNNLVWKYMQQNFIGYEPAPAYEKQ